MMTRETRILFEPADVLAFQVHCTDAACQGVVSIPLSLRRSAFPERCPLCREKWPELGDHSATITLLEALQDALWHPDEKLAIRLEIDGIAGAPPRSEAPAGGS